VILRRESAVIDGVGVKSVTRPGSVRTAKAEADGVEGESLAARRARRRDLESKK